MIDLDPTFSKVYSAVGNSEVKGALIAAMQKDRMYSRSGLVNIFHSVQGNNPAWILEPKSKTPWGYCQKTFSPIGLVTKEALNPDLTVYGWEKTDRGFDLADPLVGMLLQFSERYPHINLARLVGSTNSAAKAEDDNEEVKRRSPIIRMRIYYTLSTSPTGSASYSELIESSGSKSGLSEQINALKDYGILQYPDRYSFNPQIKLSYVQPSAEAVVVLPRRNPRMFNEIYELLKNVYPNHLAPQEVLDIMKPKFPNYKTTLESNMRLSMHYLESQGLIESHDDFPITTTSLQLAVIKDLVEIFDRLQDGNKKAIDEGKNTLSRMLARPNAICALFDKAKRSSAKLNGLPDNEKADDLLKLLQEFPNSTASQLSRQSLAVLGYRISGSVISSVMNNLQKDGLVTRESVSNVNFWNFKTSGE